MRLIWKLIELLAGMFGGGEPDPDEGVDPQVLADAKRDLEDVRQVEAEIEEIRVSGQDVDEMTFEEKLAALRAARDE